MDEAYHYLIDPWLYLYKRIYVTYNVLLYTLKEYDYLCFCRNSSLFNYIWKHKSNSIIKLKVNNQNSIQKGVRTPASKTRAKMN